MAQYNIDSQNDFSASELIGTFKKYIDIFKMLFKKIKQDMHEFKSLLKLYKYM